MTIPFFNSIWLVMLLLALVYAELTDVQKGVARKDIEECLITVHGTPDLLQNLNEGKVTNPDETTKCLIKCCHEKWGFIVDGKYNREAIIQKLSPHFGDEHLKETMEKCKDVTGDNDCDKAYKLNVCFAGNNKFIF